MKFKLIERKNPQNPTATGKFYAIAVNEGVFSMRDLAREIEGRSSLTRGDINNVIDNILDEIPTFLKLGLSVQLGEFGTLRLSIQSDGADSADAFKSNLIHGVKVIFTPSIELKKALENIHFEYVAGSATDDGGEEVLPPLG